MMPQRKIGIPCIKRPCSQVNSSIKATPPLMPSSPLSQLSLTLEGKQDVSLIASPQNRSTIAQRHGTHKLAAVGPRAHAQRNSASLTQDACSLQAFSTKGKAARLVFWSNSSQALTCCRRKAYAVSACLLSEKAINRLNTNMLFTDKGLLCKLNTKGR